MSELGKALLVLGAILIAVGGVLLLAARLGMPLGRLPGDFAWRGRKVHVYFPLGTSILISIVLTLVFWVLSRMRR